MAWVEAFRQLRGYPFRFAYRGNRPYIRDIYNRHPKDMDIMKARQVEVSEWIMNRQLRFCDLVPWVTVMHIFPTGPTTARFSRERLGPAINESHRLYAKLQQEGRKVDARVKNVLMKFLGTSNYQMASSFTEHGGRGPATDMLAYDEYDKQNPKIEGVYKHSLSHSEYGYRMRISTPTLPQRAIHAQYLEGSMSKWLYRCAHCHRDQELTFGGNIHSIPNGKSPREYGALEGHRWYIGCEKCLQPVDRQMAIETTGGEWGGRWVAGRPSKLGTHESYHITWFMAPWKFAQDIIDEYHDTPFRQIFDNETLGIPSEPEDSGVTERHLIQCCDPNLSWVQRWDGPVSVGVDWGNTSWITVRGRYWEARRKQWLPRVLWVEKVEAEDGDSHREAVARVFEMFEQNGVIVADAGYGHGKNEWLYKKFPGKVFSAYYPVTVKLSKFARPSWQPKEAKVTMDRTASLKLTLNQYKAMEVVLPASDMNLDEFIKQHTAVKVSKEMDPDTREIREVMVSVGKQGDHLCHASNYARTGYEFLFGDTYDSQNPSSVAATVVSADFAGRGSQTGGWDDGSE